MPRDNDRIGPYQLISKLGEGGFGVVGGRPRIAGTRVTVRSVAICYKHGDSPEEIALQYEHLTIAQVYAALTYYHANREEIEAEIAAEEGEYDRAANEYQQARINA